MTLDQAINEMANCNKLVNIKRKKFLIDVESNPDIDDNPQEYFCKLEELHKDIRKFIYNYVVNNIIPYYNEEEFRAVYLDWKQGIPYFILNYPQYTNKLRLINIMFNYINDYLIDRDTNI